ncbi:trihelix transcription factor ENAP1-like [Curcuma longa]|uniref:trihelix transcription factor ENAP1-like n=1 Tax=Curcuma longa TaxID=136217 RepID=UPI003D9F4188
MEKRDASATRPPNPAMPYREDCWSEGETSALVDAWGDRYIELNRGNLRQKQWQEVADAVNSRRGAGRRPPRTDVQCKNRIDTLKKKYKVEKSRVSDGGESQWPFFPRLDALVGSAPPPSSKKQPVSPPLALALPFHRKTSSLPVASAVRPAETKKKRTAVASSAVDNPFFRRAAAAAAAAAAEDDEDVEEEEEEEEEEEGSGSLSRSSSRSGRGLKREREEEGSGIRELAKAIMKFAEIYERVEESKQRQMIELEKQRMEFAKALEFQKMQIVVDSQVQLAKIKRAKRSDTDSYS